MQKPFYRQRLPHIQSPNAVYFVTYRLYGSIPVNIIEQLYLEKEQALQKLIKTINSPHPKNITYRKNILRHSTLF